MPPASREPAAPTPAARGLSGSGSASASPTRLLQASASRIRFLFSKTQFLQFLFLIENLIQACGKQTHTSNSPERHTAKRKTPDPGPQFSYTEATPICCVLGLRAETCCAWKKMTSRHLPSFIFLHKKKPMCSLRFSLHVQGIFQDIWRPYRFSSFVLRAA